ncbi:YbdD/YjiX family protein [Salana multivorans]
MRGAWRALVWWVKGVLGASAYERYLARHRVEHPDHEPLSEREFWRRRQDDAPPKGCC